MIISENKEYIISTITKITDNGIKQMPIKYGLHLCKKQPIGCYAILEIKYDDKESGCQVNGIGERILDIENWESVKPLIAEAIKKVKKANK